MIKWEYIAGFAGLLMVGKCYEKWRKYTEKWDDEKNYELVKQYLLSESSLSNSRKPIMWIHIPHEINARKWQDFYSRNSTNVNRPYLYLTIKSIVDKCGGNFNVCMITDESFANIIPGWTVDLERVADPVKSKLRELALARVLYYYGGVVMPASMVCLENMYKDLMEEMTNSSKGAVIGEFINRDGDMSNKEYKVNVRLLGCEPKSEIMKEYDEYLQVAISKDYTTRDEFVGNANTWWQMAVSRGEVGCISAKKLGVEIKSGPMTVEKLLGYTKEKLYSEALAVYYPEEDLTKRTAYRWFERQSPKQVLEGDYMAGYYLLLALANGDKNALCI